MHIYLMANFITSGGVQTIVKEMAVTDAPSASISKIRKNVQIRKVLGVHC